MEEGKESSSWRGTSKYTSSIFDYSLHSEGVYLTASYSSTTILKHTFCFFPFCPVSFTSKRSVLSGLILASFDLDNHFPFASSRFLFQRRFSQFLFLCYLSLAIYWFMHFMEEFMRKELFFMLSKKLEDQRFLLDFRALQVEQFQGVTSHFLIY